MELFQGGIAHTYEHRGGQGQGGPVDRDGVLLRAPRQEEHRQGHRQSGGSDQRRGSGAQTGKDSIHRFGLAEPLQEAGDDDDHDDRGGDQPQSGHHRAGQAGHLEAHIGGHVHPHGTGCGLGHGDHSGQVGLGEPAGHRPHVLEEGDGGQPAAHGKEPHLRELKEQPQKGPY